MKDLLIIIQAFWLWLTSIEDWRSVEGLIARFLTCVILVYLTLLLIRHTLDIVVKIQESLKTLGVPVTFSTKSKMALRRRQQFCRVLRSDIDTLNKAENWNDQFFTDLEAEIEAEGRYYASNFDRLIRRASQGLRRVQSLIRAVDTSIEPRILIVGEPGSGKSVALRHLAAQLAGKSIRSTDLKEKVPLYVNLKELPSEATEELTADFIKSFVIQNVRRGDADTADYVRENWSSYREKGIWFFLFDSFDEIPDVIHAPSGSSVIDRYTEAIRQFLDGMSDCRGCLASRKFRGPTNLSWHRFSILPLSGDRRKQLVRNSFLSSRQQQIVHKHLAAATRPIYNNPLFLTLLCRYVKQENSAPVNDYSLLERHITRLANRDPDYIETQYGLNPDGLLDAAKMLAGLFAEEQDLSLAPTIGMIDSVAKRHGIGVGDLESTIGALVDSKIGRSDVREARKGDRRFTFSHRRYQETLFVRYLSENPGYIVARELVTSPKWREYAVTLLQTQTLDTIQPLLGEAEGILRDQAKIQQSVRILKNYGGHLSYYEWDDEPLVGILRLLQEGMAQRLHQVPKTLSEAVEMLLAPRWTSGDFLDRKMVLEVGGLLPAQTLLSYIRYAVDQGNSDLQDAAFSRVTFLRNASVGISDWIRRRISDGILLAKNRVDLLRIEALASRLPDAIGASFVLKRSQRFRKIVPAFGVLAVSPGLGWLIPRYKLSLMILFQLVCAPMMVIGFAFFLDEFPHLFSAALQDQPSAGEKIKELLLISLLLAIWSAYSLSLYLLRDSGRRIDLEYLRYLLRKEVDAKRLIQRVAVGLGALVTLFLMVLVPGGLAHLFAHFVFDLEVDRPAWYFSWFFATFFCLIIVISVSERNTEIKRKQRLRRFLAEASSDGSVPLHAMTLSELDLWLRLKPADLLPDKAHVRSLARVLLAKKEEHPEFIRSTPLFQADLKEEEHIMGAISSRLRERLESLYGLSLESKIQNET